MPTRAVLDTNVLISGLITEGGPACQAVDAWLENKYTLVISLYLVQEITAVLSYPRIRARIRLDERELEAIVAALLSQAEVTPGRLHMPGATRDPKDDAIVACAIEGNADVIVSGDQDLLALGDDKGVRVVTPRQFVEMLAATR